MPPTACKTGSCPGMAVERGLCELCLKTAPAAEPKFISKYDDSRPWRNLYWKARWRHPVTGLQAHVMRRDPICKECNRNASTIADHKVDHRGDPVKFFDPKNLRGVCKDCHDVKTGAMHGSGDRQPDKQGLVDGKVKDYAPKADAPSTKLPEFDFLAAMNKHKKSN